MIKEKVSTLKNYFIKERGLWFLSIVCLLVILGHHLFTNNVSIDTELLLLNPISNYNWLSIGRYGLVLIKDFLGLYSFNPYYSAGVFFILLTMITFYWFYFVDKYINKKNKLMMLLSIFIIFGSTVYTEQFYFTLQRVGIAAGILITLISSDLSYEYVHNNDKTFAITSVLLNLLAFGIYQAFVPLYLTLISGIYLSNNNFISYSNKRIEFQKLKKFLLRVGTIFVVSYLGFSFISKIFSDSQYLTASIVWGKRTVVSVIVRIILRIGYVMIINNKFYDLSLFIVSIILLILQIKNLKNGNKVYKFKSILAVLTFLVTPFLIIIYSGSNQPVRTFLNLPFVVSLGYMIVYDKIDLLFSKKKKVKLARVFICLIFMFFAFKQYHMSSRLYYADDIMSSYDRQLALNIYKDASNKVDDISKYHLFIVGRNNFKLPKSAQEGDLVGKSLFNIHSDVEPNFYWSTARICNLLEINGIVVNEPSSEMSSRALQYLNENRDIPNYPNQSSIVVDKDLIIVKLSDDF